MKSTFVILLVIVLSLTGSAAYGQCTSLTLDLLTGTLNGIRPDDSQEKIKQVLPCYTGETEEGDWANYGGGIFYLKHDMYFYTHRDYIEVRDGFISRLPFGLAFGISSLKAVDEILEKIPEFKQVFRGTNPLPENVLVSIDENHAVYQTPYGYVSFIFKKSEESEEDVLKMMRIFRPKRLFE